VATEFCFVREFLSFFLQNHSKRNFVETTAGSAKNDEEPRKTPSKK
jgi:hypothetical protein|tara:strand:- start:64 stop:201 length:138 start_codon:yes stop_codon:yes gene_type:complete